MKGYLLTTAAVFGAIVLAHLWRVFAESPRLARDPGFVVLTVVAAALCGWALRLARRAR